MTQGANLRQSTVDGFGYEWTRSDQSQADPRELDRIFDMYFRIFPWEKLPPHAVGIDVGCGSGRWAKRVAPRVGKIYCLDASPAALDVARKNLAGETNCEFINATVDRIPLEDASLDFAYSLGVLHHIPDTSAGLSSCVRKLKPGAPMLVYLYYAFDNKPAWFRHLWRVSNVARVIVSALPHRLRGAVTDVIAATVYFPAARINRIARARGVDTHAWPLALYADKSFYTMRTDALDRFGTNLEHRFTAEEISQMMRDAGLEKIEVSTEPPYWCAVGYRK